MGGVDRSEDLVALRLVFPLKDWENGGSVSTRQVFQASGGEEGGGDVDAGDEVLLIASAGFRMAGPADDPGSGVRGQVAVGFCKREGHAVIRNENYQGVVRQAGFVDFRHDGSDDLIRAMAGGKIIGKLGADAREIREETGDDDLLRGDPAGDGEQLLVIAFATREGAVRIMGVGHDKKGFACLFRPGDGVAYGGSVCGGIAALADIALGANQVESGVTGRDDVDHLAEERVEIAAFCQCLRQRRAVGIDVVKTERTVAVRIAACHPDSTGRLANGDRDKAPVEGLALRGQLVHVRGDVLDRAAVGSDGIAVHVIDRDEQQVGPFGGVGGGQKEDK